MIPATISRTGPHYGGSGLNHGIQIRNGPHAGRLAMARRLNCKAAMGDHNEQQYFHSFVIFSDNNGAHTPQQRLAPAPTDRSVVRAGVSWTAGQLLPKGWTECQVAEMTNGSLLMTSRMYGSPWLTPGRPMRSDLRRGFARSDDGGWTVRALHLHSCRAFCPAPAPALRLRGPSDLRGP